MKFSTKEMNQVLIIEIYGEIMGGGEADGVLQHRTSALTAWVSIAHGVSYK